MAHFVELNQQSIVLRVIVISNDDILNEDGVEVEQLGIQLCEQIAGPGRWLQTSYNGNFRKMFARPGFIYSDEADLFYLPIGPFPSWVLNDEYDWVAPVPMPDDGNVYLWDESLHSWVQIDEEPED